MFLKELGIYLLLTLRQHLGSFESSSQDNRQV